jgi:beta-fructofuranosidase
MRPLLHFTARSGWINDPHGITARDGEYHLFFQYVPDSLEWKPNCHWGHAVAPDLFSWMELPVAIAPGDGDDGIWTGSLVTDDAGATRIFYTSTSLPDFGIGHVRVATPDDPAWLGWTKGEVVVEAPEGLDLIAYRDPFVVRDSDAWRMFVGAGSRDGTAMALAYRSDDLETWTYERVAAQRSTDERAGVWTGALWECPQIFEIDGRWVLLSSVWDADVLHYAAYAIGTYSAGVFTPESWGRLTWGPSYYAPSFFRDAADRPCVTFWLRGVKDEEAGWASAHSIPHVLSLAGDVLVASPHPDLLSRRGTVATDGRVPALAADVEWGGVGELAVSSGDALVLRLRSTGAGELALDAGGETWTVPHLGGPVRVVVDGPVVEVSTREGLLALAIDPQGVDLTIEGADSTVWPLS